MANVEIKKIVNMNITIKLNEAELMGLATLVSRCTSESVLTRLGLNDLKEQIAVHADNYFEVNTICK